MSLLESGSLVPSLCDLSEHFHDELMVSVTNLKFAT